MLTPSSAADAAAALATASAEGRSLRFRGAGTKLGWGRPGPADELELSLEALNRTLEHNVGDLTAGFEAGASMHRIQTELARSGQRVALDPPLSAVEPNGTEGASAANGAGGAGGANGAGSGGAGASGGATLGGILATGDSGPLRHRYGAPRDLVLGMTVALSDGTIARSGGKVIKNVAGYDVAKLFTGSFGTLGLILAANLRLHPLPDATATALAACDDGATLTAGVLALSRAPLELEALDIAWRAGRGGILAQSAGAQAERRAARVASLMRDTGLDHVDVTPDDAPLWARQRAGQRSARRALVRVAARPSQLPLLLAATDLAGGTLVGRAALGISYVELDPDALEPFYRALPDGALPVLQDAPTELREALDPWSSTVVAEPLLELMERIKERFDPARTCNRGLFVGGL